MDGRLAAWARQVKARGRAGGAKVGCVKAGCVKAGGMAGRGLPSLWLFTDAVRLPDPLPAIARLPPGCGVVLRHDGVPGRAALAAAAARLCRERGLVMVVAGDPRLAAAAGAGLHLRVGRAERLWRRAWLRRGRPVTSSAHDGAELLRARRAGADAAFLSPLFQTGSHPGARPLGPVRWAALARGARGAALALGGVAGGTVRRVPRSAQGAGLIGAALEAQGGPEAPPPPRQVRPRRPL